MLRLKFGPAKNAKIKVLLKNIYSIRKQVFQAGRIEWLFQKTELNQDREKPQWITKNFPLVNSGYRIILEDCKDES